MGHYAPILDKEGKKQYKINPDNGRKELIRDFNNWIPKETPVVLLTPMEEAMIEKQLKRGIFEIDDWPVLVLLGALFSIAFIASL